MNDDPIRAVELVTVAVALYGAEAVRADPRDCFEKAGQVLAEASVISEIAADARIGLLAHMADLKANRQAKDEKDAMIPWDEARKQMPYARAEDFRILIRDFCAASPLYSCMVSLSKKHEFTREMVDRLKEFKKKRAAEGQRKGLIESAKRRGR